MLEDVHEELVSVLLNSDVVSLLEAKRESGIASKCFTATTTQMEGHIVQVM